jgi:hypothetical protein
MDRQENDGWKGPFIVLGTFMGTTAAALKGFGEKEEGMLGCTVLEDREKGEVSTVEVHAHKEVWEDVYQKSEALVGKNEDSTVEIVVKLRNIA